ncbi:tyrosine--tRNA ligase [Patescibacteria group bacterium]|nr:tyrosine--tRNA ligase [Patescibacteria group bacterium]
MTNDLLTRAVEDVVPRDLAEKKLKAKKPIRIYWGIDPTGSKLHLGHSVPLRKFKAFADAGHEVIFLIGSFTAMVGDPSGRDAMRKPLTKKQVEENFKSYKKQAAKILDFKKVKVEYNHKWLEKLKFDELINLARNFTVQQMVQRNMFKQRLKDDHDISLVEFLYPIMVGYDSVMLDVDCEMGGNDQLFNMLCGRKLQKAFKKREKFVLTTKLLLANDGRKMSKTYENCIYLDDEPDDMFGKVMSINDDLMETYFECCTDVPLDEVKKILKGNPRDAKARLASEIVTLYHGDKKAAKASEAFDRVFKGKEAPDNIPEAKCKNGSLLVDVLVKNGIVSSKSEARRVIEQGGMKMNDKPVTSADAVAEEGICKVGKRKFLRINYAN